MFVSQDKNTGPHNDDRGRWSLDPVFRTRRMAQLNGPGSAGAGLPDDTEAKNLPVSRTLKINEL